MFAETADPFGLASTPSAYVPRASTEHAMTSLDEVLREGKVPALVGPPGLGKTLLFQRIAARVEHRTAPVYVPYCTLTLPELCALVLGLVEEPPSDDPVATLTHIAEELRRQRSGLVLLIDDAAMMPLETAEGLAEWLESTRGAFGLALAAVKSPEADVVFAKFGERLERVPLDDEMSIEETHQYVDHRLAIVAAPPQLRDAFDERTVLDLHHLSHGVPRALNVAAQEVVRASTPDAAPRLQDLYARARHQHDTDAKAPPERDEPGEDDEPLIEYVTEESARPHAEVAHHPPPIAADAARVDFNTTVDETTGRYRVVRGRTVRGMGEISGCDEGRAYLEEFPSTGKVELMLRVEEPAAEPEITAPPPKRAAVAAPGAPSFWTRALGHIDRASRRPATVMGTMLGAILLGLAYGWVSAGLPDTPAPEPVEVSRPAPTQEIHTIGVNATPWALIEVDGKEMGETPIAALKLAYGNHIIRAYLPNGEVHERRIMVDGTRLNVSFQ